MSMDTLFTLGQGDIANWNYSPNVAHSDSPLPSNSIFETQHVAYSHLL